MSEQFLHGLPITPPTTELDPQSEQILFSATHVLSTEATALSHLSRLYATDPVARNGFVRAVETIQSSLERGGKVVVVGVGKSGKIGEKMVATMNSLGLVSVFMHPVEACHGDLGIIRPNDTLLFITYSGNTPELLALFPHLQPNLPLILLTSHTSYTTAKMTSIRPNTVLLPAPIPESETATFGLPAPTTSTTVAMALCDALALTIAKSIYPDETTGGPREVFRRNHPGGAIGLNLGHVSVTMASLATALVDIPVVVEEDDSRPASPSSEMSDSDSCHGSSSSDVGARVLDCLLLAVRSPNGWVKTSRNEVVPPRALQRVRDPSVGLREAENGLLVPSGQWIKVPGESSVEECRKWIQASLAGSDEDMEGRASVVGVVVDRRVVGVVEVEDVMGQR